MKNWFIKNVLLENPNNVDDFGLICYLVMVTFLFSTYFLLFGGAALFLFF
jgi:hypothetical protein